MRDLVFSIPNPHLPLLGARLHDLDLLQIDQIICFMLVIQFTRDTVAGGVICSWITDTSLKGQQFALNSCKVHKKDSFRCLDGDSSNAIFFDRKASLRNIWGKETNEMECWILPRGWCEEREGGRQRPTLFVVVVSIDADYEDVGYPECMTGYLSYYRLSPYISYAIFPQKIL